MTADYIRTLVAYHYWARDRMLAAIASLSSDDYTRDLGNSFSSVRATAQHIYAAEVVWLKRWQGESVTSFPSDLPHDVVLLRDAWTVNEHALRAFTDSLSDDDLACEHQYRLMSGVECQSTMWEMIVHVVNHATYHRGQITTMLRQLGGTASSTDMIAFFRERRGPQSPA